MRTVPSACQQRTAGSIIHKVKDFGGIHALHGTAIELEDGQEIDKLIYLVGSLVGYVGIDTSGFAALLASLGVGLGVALNGTLGNLAGGVLLLVTRPFRVGDYVALDGREGSVEDLRLVYTRLRTFDNKIVYIPNGTAATAAVTNFSELPLRRLDLTFRVAYGGDVDRARGLILGVCAAHGRVLGEPAASVRVCERGGSAIVLLLRAWVENEDYFDVRFDLLEQVGEALRREGIRTPYPRLDIDFRSDGQR